MKDQNKRDKVYAIVMFTIVFLIAAFSLGYIFYYISNL